MSRGGLTILRLGFLFCCGVGIEQLLEKLVFDISLFFFFINYFNYTFNFSFFLSLVLKRKIEYTK